MVSVQWGITQVASEETRSLAQCRAWHSCSGVYVFCCCNLLQGVRISLRVTCVYGFFSVLWRWAATRLIKCLKDNNHNLTKALFCAHILKRRSLTNCYFKRRMISLFVLLFPLISFLFLFKGTRNNTSGCRKDWKIRRICDEILRKAKRIHFNSSKWADREACNIAHQTVYNERTLGL